MSLLELALLSYFVPGGLLILGRLLKLALSRRARQELQEEVGPELVKTSLVIGALLALWAWPYFAYLWLRTWRS